MPFEKIVKRDQYGQPGVELAQVEVLDSEARLACALIERWGIVAGMPDGEDSAGRQRLRKMTPDELVTEACTTAEHALAEFRARGWMGRMPSQQETDSLCAAWQAEMRVQVSDRVKARRVEVEPIADPKDGE